MPINRADKFTVSPTVVNSRLSWEPTTPQKTRPEPTPTQARSALSPSSLIIFLSRSPSLTARSGSSACGRGGKPKTHKSTVPLSSMSILFTFDKFGGGVCDRVCEPSSIRTTRVIKGLQHTSSIKRACPSIPCTADWTLSMACCPTRCASSEQPVWSAARMSPCKLMNKTETFCRGGARVSYAM
eukprot:929709-Prymnesium_polylepis.1